MIVLTNLRSRWSHRSSRSADFVSRATELERTLQTCQAALGLRWWLSAKDLAAVTNGAVSVEDLIFYADSDTVKTGQTCQRGLIVLRLRREVYFLVFPSSQHDDEADARAAVPQFNHSDQSTVETLFKENYLRNFQRLCEELCREAKSHLDGARRLGDFTLGLPLSLLSYGPRHTPLQRAIVLRFSELAKYLPTPDERETGDVGGPPAALVRQAEASQMDVDAAPAEDATMADDAGTASLDAEEPEGETGRRDEAIAAVGRLSEQSGAGCVEALALEEYVVLSSGDADLRRSRRENAHQVWTNEFTREFSKLWFETKLKPVFLTEEREWGSHRERLMLYRPPWGEHDFCVSRDEVCYVFDRYTFNVGGSDVNRVREARLAAIKTLKASFYSQYASGMTPLGDVSLLEFLIQRRRFISGNYVLVGRTALRNLRASAESSAEPAPAADAPPSEDDAYKIATRGLVEMCPKSGTPRMPHRAVATLRSVRHKCNVSDKATLLLQYLMFEFFFGFAPEASKASALFIGGSQCTRRERQLDWRDREIDGERLASAPGLWCVGLVLLHLGFFGLLTRVWSDDRYFTSDATGIEKKGDFHSKHIHFWDAVAGRPDNIMLSVASLPGKSSAAAAGESVKRIREQPGCAKCACYWGGLSYPVRVLLTMVPFLPCSIKESAFGGGNSDNASAAEDEISQVGELLLGEDSHDIWWFGDPCHKEHLHAKWGRAMSFGGKTDMHDPNHLQLAYKYHRIWSSDPSLFRALMVDFFREYATESAMTAHPNGQGWWSKAPVGENEGRWGVSFNAMKHIRRLM